MGADLCPHCGAPLGARGVCHDCYGVCCARDGRGCGKVLLPDESVHFFAHGRLHIRCEIAPTCRPFIMGRSVPLLFAPGG